MPELDFIGYIREKMARYIHSDPSTISVVELDEERARTAIGDGVVLKSEDRGGGWSPKSYAEVTLTQDELGGAKVYRVSAARSHESFVVRTNACLGGYKYHLLVAGIGVELE